MPNNLFLQKAKDLLILEKEKQRKAKSSNRKIKELIQKMDDFEITHNLIDNE